MKIILPNGLVLELKTAYSCVPVDGGFELREQSGLWVATVPPGSAIVEWSANPKIGGVK